jgi:protein-tyrosine phosphatase
VRQVSDYPLWLGHVGDVRDPRSLLSAGVVAVVDLALNEPPATLNRELVYLRFPLVDAPGNPNWLLRAAIESVATLLRSNTPMFVYCANGLSRSPCIAGAAIALVRNCSPAAGLAIVAKSGPADVSPGLWADVQAAIA